jgi:hypothetical protein
VKNRLDLGVRFHIVFSLVNQCVRVINAIRRLLCYVLDLGLCEYEFFSGGKAEALKGRDGGPVVALRDY